MAQFGPNTRFCEALMNSAVDRQTDKLRGSRHLGNGYQDG